MNDLNLTEVDKYRLNEINKIKEYFNKDINERKDMNIASHATVIGIPTGIAGASLTLIFTITTGINKSLLQVTKKKKKKQNEIITLAKDKLNMIDTLLSSALNDLKISHEVPIL